MTPYIFLFIICILCSFFKKNKIVGAIIMFTLFFYSFFRADSVGTDTMNYMDINRIYRISELDFSDMNMSNLNVFLEFSAYLIVKLAVYLNNPRIIISIYAIVNFVFLYLAFKKLNINKGIGFTCFLLFGLFTISLNISRQIAACSIIAYGIAFLVKDKNIKCFIALVLLSSSFHFSSIIAIFLIFVSNFKMKFNTVIKLLIVSLILLLIVPINNLISMINISYLQTYEDVLNTGRDLSLNGKIFLFLYYSFFIFIFILSARKREITSFDIFFTISLIIDIMFGSMDFTISRIAIPFQIILLLYVSYYFSYVNFKKVNTLIIYIFFLLLFGYNSFTGIMKNAGGVFPYESYNLYEFPFFYN